MNHFLSYSIIFHIANVQNWCAKLNLRLILFVFLIFIGFKNPLYAQECVERKPISVAIGIDVSGSMSGNIATARDFAINLINGLGNTGQLIEVDIFLFNNLVPACAGSCGEFIWGSKSSSITWVSSLDEVHAGGGTALFSAAFVGANITKNRSSSNFKLFVLVTDGDDDGSSVVTINQASSELGSSGLTSRLIFVGSSSSGSATLNSMASAAGSNCQAFNSSFANLNNLVSGIVASTCVNHKPVASFTKSDSNLQLGIEGFTIDFNGSGSNDQETSSSSLTYEWTFTRPDGSTYTKNSRTFTETFNDSQLNTGTNWSVSLRVKDAKDVWSNRVSQNFTVTGSPPNITLSVSPSNPFDANVSASVEANPANDIDGGPMTFLWTILNAPISGILPTPLNTRVIPLSSQEENITTYSDGVDFRTLWHFQCLATDNEGDTDTKEIEIRIRNIPPDINFIGDTEIDVNFPIQVSTDILDDEDGGALSFVWDIIQAPNSAPIAVQDGFSTSSTFNLPTTEAYAGTWRLRLTATDNEGEDFSDTFSVLVDGLPEVHITGPTTSIGSIFGFPLTLDGSSSFDSDTRDDLPNNGHDTSDPPIQDISPGIISYNWSIIDAPLDNPDLFALGRVDEVLGINGGGSTLTIPLSKRLSPGYYTFLLEIEDGEGNIASEEYQVDVVEDESKPGGILIPPFISVFLDPITNTVTSDISIYGGWSFDPDNLLISPFTAGITNYSWTYTHVPLGCSFLPIILPNGPTADTVNLFPAGMVIPLNCQGLWSIALEVTDDDAIPKVNDPLAEAIIVIGNCPSNLCIDYPTNANPQTIQFTDATDVTIYFHLNAILYANPAALFGTIASLEIIHESDPVPFFTSDDPNLLATDTGGYLSFKWNGYGNGNQRPKPGKYHVRISLLDQGMVTSIGGDDQLNAILIAVADPTILPTSDKIIARDKLLAGTDQVDINYSISGGGNPDEMKWRIYDSGNAVVFEGIIIAPANNASFSWDGNNTVPALVPEGKYFVELETFLGGLSMGKSTKHEVTIITCDLDADTNRDATIDNTGDDINEDTWSTTLGSIFNVNYDRDGSRVNGALPIGDVLFINNSGIPTLEDKNIDNASDEADITPFVIRKIMDDIPAGLKVYLKAASPEDIQSIHVYKKIAAGETAIWGSLGTRIGGPPEPLEIDITNYVNPTHANFQGDPITKDCTFGLEGMFFRNTGMVNPFDGIIELTLEIREGAVLVSSDVIKMKVAPFLMLSHLQSSMEVWVEDIGAANVEMRETVSAMPGYFALENSSQMQQVNGSDAGTQWFQDHLEIGYYQRPGGNKDHCVFRLPYTNGPTSQPHWPLTNLLGSGVGEFQLGELLAGGGSGDFGGNVEIIPRNSVNKNGRVVIGTRRSGELFTFFQSQEVQDPIQVNTKWLQVGHVDEIFGFTANPNEMIVANPADAYALMNAIPVSDRGKSVFFSTGTALPISGSVSSDAVVGNIINTGIDHTAGPPWGFIRIYDDSASGSGSVGQIARISSLNNGSIEIDRVWLTGSMVLPLDPILTRYGNHVLGLSAPHQAVWFSNPHVGDKYVLMEGTREWNNGTPAAITVFEILSDSELRDLNLIDVASEITTIKTTIETANGLPMNFISVPTIYFGKRAGFSTNQSCVALTPGLANFQPVNGGLYFPQQFGPKNALGNDIFEKTTLIRVPLALFTDDWRIYHALEGEVHCGTNVKRTIPVFNWWTP